MPTIWVSAAKPEDYTWARGRIVTKLLETEPFNPGRWQQLDTTGSEAHKTYELIHLNFHYPMPQTIDEAKEYIQPDLPWADGHFRERVEGLPLNPGNWHDKWPYHAGRVKLHQEGGKYEHNYMERFWPKEAGMADSARGSRGWRYLDERAYGYRYPIGDLWDVIWLLKEEPSTRQAYLPVWFPEDTGATEGQRVPCTLGYHFMIRENKLHVAYHLRSCEAYRHFTNDIYMAVRLAQYVAGVLRNYDAPGNNLEMLAMGNLHFTAASFHGFVGDQVHLEEMCV